MSFFDFVKFSTGLLPSDWGVKVPVVTRDSTSREEDTKSLLSQYKLVDSIELQPWSEVNPEKSLRCLNLIRRVVKENLGFCFVGQSNLVTISQLLDNCIKVISLWFEFFEVQHDFLATQTQRHDILALKERLANVSQGLLRTKTKITQLKTALLTNSSCHRYRLIYPSGQTILFSLSATPPAQSFKFWRKLTRILNEGYDDSRVQIDGPNGTPTQTWQASELKAPSCTVRFLAISSSSLPFALQPFTKISKALGSLLKLHSSMFEDESIQIENSSQQTFGMVIQLLLSKKSTKITWANIHPLLNAAKELKIEALEKHLSKWLVTSFNAFDANDLEGYEKAKEWYPISSRHPLPELKISLTWFFNKRLQHSLQKTAPQEDFEGCIEDFKRLCIEEVDLRKLEHFSYTTDKRYLIGIAQISTLKRLYLGEYPLIIDDILPLNALSQLEHLEALDCHLLERDAVTYLSCMTSLTSLSLLKLANLKKDDFSILGRLPLREASFVALNDIETDSFKSLTQLQTLALLKMPHIPEGLLENLSLITTLRRIVLDRVTDTARFYEVRSITSLIELDIWECSGARKNSIVNLPTSYLRKLTLYGKNLGDPGVSELHLLPNLESLSLSCSITTLGSLYSLTKLRELNLSGCSELPNDSLERLTCLTALNQLRLIDCRKINDTGLGHLSKMSRLTMLDLRSSSFSIDALEQLLEMPRLSEIYLSRDHQTTNPDASSRFERKALVNNKKVIFH